MQEFQIDHDSGASLSSTGKLLAKVASSGNPSNWPKLTYTAIPAVTEEDRTINTLKRLIDEVKQWSDRPINRN